MCSRISETQNVFSYVSQNVFSYVCHRMCSLMCVTECVLLCVRHRMCETQNVFSYVYNRMCSLTEYLGGAGDVIADGGGASFFLS